MHEVYLVKNKSNIHPHPQMTYNIPLQSAAGYTWAAIKMADTGNPTQF